MKEWTPSVGIHMKGHPSGAHPLPRASWTRQGNPRMAKAQAVVDPSAQSEQDFSDALLC